LNSTYIPISRILPQHLETPQSLGRLRRLASPQMIRCATVHRSEVSSGNHTTQRVRDGIPVLRFVGIGSLRCTIMTWQRSSPQSASYHIKATKHLNVVLVSPLQLRSARLAPSLARLPIYHLAVIPLTKKGSQMRMFASVLLLGLASEMR
jgi:hypothetical protein